MIEQRITAVHVDDDSVIVAEIVVVSYINSDGEECFAIALNGEMMQSQIVGLFEMAKNVYINGTS